MERPEFASKQILPAYDTLTDSFQENAEGQIVYGEIEPYLCEYAHAEYLKNDTFHRYLKMHKVAPGTSGLKIIRSIGDELKDEYMPTLKDAAAWAYAESGMFDTSLSTVERVDLVTKAEELWTLAVKREIGLQTSEYGQYFDEPDSPYRLALPLAYAPLMKSIIVGNVTAEVRQQALRDTVSMASEVSSEIERYENAGIISSKNMFVGLSHELNALSTFLYLDDPRYIPMPSTSRADTGYYHRAQTHDIMIINQHWGTVKKIIPIEIKAKARMRDRRRYKSLIIRGKMHLATSPENDSETTTAYVNMLNGVATVADIVDIERIATETREMLRLYQQGSTATELALRSLTRFQQSKNLERAYPEIAPY